MPEFPRSRDLKIKVLSSRECLEYIHVIAHGIVIITLWCKCAYYFILMGQESMHRYLMQDFPRVSALMIVWLSSLLWIPFSIGLKYLSPSQEGLSMWFDNTIVEYIQVWQVKVKTLDSGCDDCSEAGGIPFTWVFCGDSSLWMEPLCIGHRIMFCLPPYPSVLIFSVLVLILYVLYNFSFLYKYTKKTNTVTCQTGLVISSCLCLFLLEVFASRSIPWNIPSKCELF